MLVIQHRVNELNSPLLSDIGEIDVHIDQDGNIIVKHNVDAYGWKVDYFLRNSKHSKFFVDIKQNLPVHWIEHIIDTFGDKLIGIFDVPMPSAYFLARKNIDFYARISEFEVANTLTNSYWLDPLSEWDMVVYNSIITRGMFVNRNKTIVACPSLHGQSIKDCEKVWRYLRNKGDFQGIVTKHVEECRSILNE